MFSYCKVMENLWTSEPFCGLLQKLQQRKEGRAITKRMQTPTRHAKQQILMHLAQSMQKKVFVE
jgi:hypothetical protein